MMHFVQVTRSLTSRNQYSNTANVTLLFHNKRGGEQVRSIRTTVFECGAQMEYESVHSILCNIDLTGC